MPATSPEAIRRKRQGYRLRHPEQKRKDDALYWQRHRVEINRRRRIVWSIMHPPDTWY